MKANDLLNLYKRLMVLSPNEIKVELKKIKMNLEDWATFMYSTFAGYNPKIVSSEIIKELKKGEKLISYEEFLSLCKNGGIFFGCSEKVAKFSTEPEEVLMELEMCKERVFDKLTPVNGLTNKLKTMISEVLGDGQIFERVDEKIDEFDFVRKRLLIILDSFKQLYVTWSGFETLEDDFKYSLDNIVDKLFLLQNHKKSPLELMELISKLEIEPQDLLEYLSRISIKSAQNQADGIAINLDVSGQISIEELIKISLGKDIVYLNALSEKIESKSKNKSLRQKTMEEKIEEEK